MTLTCRCGMDMEKEAGGFSLRRGRCCNQESRSKRMTSGLAIHNIMMRICCHTATATITSSRRHLFSKSCSNIQSASGWGNLKRFLSLRPPPPPPTLLPHCFSSASSLSSITDASSVATTSTPALSEEDVMMGYVFGKKKATQVAHSLWKRVVQKGDVVIDATCGNGHDTLALVNLVADNTIHGGRVYAMDIQKVSLETTSLLLDQSLTPDLRKHVELFLMCHSKMEEVVPSDVAVRLVVFNLGYLPGGQKALITRSETTLLALEAAKRVLAPGGLISIVVYVGHPGGREEFEMVQAFASELPVQNWVCTKLQMLNRPSAPMIILLYSR
nr:uncharacterized protein LOC113690564 [Coffea arabica]